jgi:hypothetical protein
MITEIIKMVQMIPHYGVSEDMEIAKGRYHIPRSWRRVYEQIKRRWKR